MVNGKSAPLLAVAGLNSYQQVNFQIPWDVGLSDRINVLAYDSTDKLVFSGVAPQSHHGGGIYRSQQGYAAAIHSDSRPVTHTDPALPGEMITLFASGLGPTNPQPADGEPAPSSPPAELAAPWGVGWNLVRLGNEQCYATFAGLVPGFVGIYQINFAVPLSLLPGDQSICLSCGIDNSVKLPVGAAH